MQKLITDRTNQDVQKAKDYISRYKLGQLNEEEMEEYMAGLKGCYNVMDLNRIDEWSKYLSDKLKSLGYNHHYVNKFPESYIESGGTHYEWSSKEVKVKKLKYIESTGTQYIDTGIKTTNKTRFELDVQYTNTTKTSINGLGGIYTNSRCAMGYHIDYSGFYFGVAGVNTHIGTKDTNRHQFYIDFKNSKFGVSDLNLNGDITTDIDAGYDLYLFARKGSASAETLAYQKLYGCKIYDDEVLVRDFIPALDDNNVVCLFDTVSQTYFYNKGTGNFKAGTMIKCDYLESTGTQYIDTGVVPNSKTRMELKFKLNNIDTTQNMGWTGNSPTEAFAIEMNATNSEALGFNSYVTSNFTRRVSGVLLDTDIHIYDLQSGSQKFDGVEYATDSMADTAVSGQTMYLFGVHAEWITTGAHLKNYANIYYCKIWEGSILVRDFIPVIDGDGIPCMFDNISQSFFYNKGAGDFIAGNESYKKLEYIESTGVQYIDTNFKHNQNSRFVIDFEVSSHTAWDNIFGSFGGPRGSNKFMFLGMNLSSIGSYYAYYGSSINDYIGNSSVGRHTADFNKNVLTIDDLIYTYGKSTFQSDYNDYIFAVTDYDGSVGHPASMKLYSCKIYDNGILVRDFVPVLGIEGEPCLYDKISDTYFYNQGEGQFLTPESYEIVIYSNNYIESSGTQYIDTEVLASEDIKVELKFKFNNISGTQLLLGASEAYWDSRNLQISAYQNTETVYRFGDKNIVVQDSEILSNYSKVINTVTIDKNAVKYEAGGEVKHYQIGYNGTFESDKTIQIFARNANYFALAKVYSCKIWQNDILIRDLIPSVNDLGEACLYDKVTKRNFNNKGTGTFTGNYTKVNSEQYIDTEIIPDQDTRIETKVKGDYLNVCWYGARNASYQGIYNYNGRFDWLSYTGEGNSVQVNPDKSIWNTIHHGRILIINDKTITEFSKGNFNAAANLLIFSANYSGGLGAFAKIKVQYFKIYQKDVLVRHLIPAIDGEGVACMYDIVTNKYFYNKGTGKFKVKPISWLADYNNFTDVSFFNIYQSTTREIIKEVTPVSDTFIRFGQNGTYPANGFKLSDKPELDVSGNIVACILYKYNSNTTNKPRVGWYKEASGYGAWNVTSSDFWGAGMDKLGNWKIKRVKWDAANYNDIKNKGLFGFCQLLNTDNVVLDIAAITFYSVSDEDYKDNTFINTLPVINSYTTHYKYGDVITLQDSNRIVNNLKNIRAAFKTYSTTPATPSTLDKINVVNANNIEKIINDLNIIILNMESNFIKSGVARAGQKRFIQQAFRRY